MNWSSGKDAAYALFELQRNSEFKVDLLFTTILKETQRIGMHGLSRAMLETQSKAIGLPLKVLELENPSEMSVYERQVKESIEDLKELGYEACAFGDIFLEDLKNYREKQLKEVGIQAQFPIWKKNTKRQFHDFLEAGFKAVVVSANAKWFDADFVGRVLDEKFLTDLPSEVDPCGENGEFHTFCYDGPIFRNAVNYKVGEKCIKSYPSPNKEGEKIDFWFCDIEPSDFL